MIAFGCRRWFDDYARDMPANETMSAEQPMRFRRLVALQRELLGKRLHDLASLEVALMACDPQHPDRELAQQELIRRLESHLHSRACSLCRRLSHCGGNCPRHRCDQAFPSVVRSLVRRVLGVEGTLMTRGGAVDLVKLPPRRAPRTATPANTVRRWIGSPKQAEVSMEAFVVTEINRAAGVTSDARREWNSDRRLPVRINLRRQEREALDGRMRRLAEQPEGVAALLKECGPRNNAAKWLDHLYNDACENARDFPFERLPVDYERLLRSVAPSGSGDQRRIDLLRRFVEELLARPDLEADAESDELSRLLDGHFQPAWDATRGRCGS